jgi:hypothetical protein
MVGKTHPGCSGKGKNVRKFRHWSTIGCRCRTALFFATSFSIRQQTESQALRLTLRTLLAYLDDTLDATEVKQIGQKVAESDTAQELIARIKQVTRRRRLTTPPTGGPGPKVDPNTIAEYLENKLSEDQVAEVEQVCLGSDVHLAELAACHQLLTLILGEPILIPPTSRQRMYGLVKGREAIPFRKPRPERQGDDERTSEESYQQDETLRLGLPAWRRRSSWASRLTLLGGTLAACLLLVVAIWQALQPASLPEDSQQQSKDNGSADKKPGRTDNDGKDKPDTGKKPGNNKKVDGKDEPKPPKGNGDEKPEPYLIAKFFGIDDPTKLPKTVDSVSPAWKAVPVEAPSDVVLEAGEHVLTPGESEALLQRLPNGNWQQISPTKAEVRTGLPLLSLPGFQSKVTLKDDTLQLRLIGVLPEESPSAFLAREALITMHKHDELDLDLTLHRGRILVTNRQKTPAQIRLRFHNTTEPDQHEVWDLLLKDKGAEVFIERTTAIPLGEPFYLKPKKPGERKGPATAVHVVVREGTVELRRNQATYHLRKPPGDARFYWVSTTGVGKEKLEQLPDYASDKFDMPEPKFPADMKPEMKKQILDYHKKFLETRQKMKEARKKLTTDLLASPDKIEAVLKSLMKAKKPDEYAERILAVRCYGAVDRVDRLVDELANKDFIDVRRTAVDTLRRWLSYEWDNDHVVYQVLTDQALYMSLEAADLIRMLHGFSATEALASPPVIYDALIGRLNDDKLALRELAGLALYVELPRYFSQPVGLDIEYAPNAPEDVRAKAVKAWQKLLKENKLPPKGGG